MENYAENVYQALVQELNLILVNNPKQQQGKRGKLLVEVFEI